MTTPTQAQIEAAAKAIENLEPFEVYDCTKAAIAALTAAARIGEQENSQPSKLVMERDAALSEVERFKMENAEKKKLLNITKALLDNAEAECSQLKAAAQVGERDKFYDNFHGDAAERAAQVGEKTKTQEAYEAGLEDGRVAAQIGEQDSPRLKAYELRVAKEIAAATIERCAQVCDEAANDPRATKEYRFFCINMAAAIRNLDDNGSSKSNHKFSPGAYLQMCAICGLDRRRHPQAEG